MEWNDPRPPTYDGRRWHLARLTSETDILHEVAHWIVAPASARERPNYGLGTDPDGGPKVLADALSYVPEGDQAAAADVIAKYAERDPHGVIALFEAKSSREEELASVVTVILLRLAGLPWAATMRRVFGKLVDVSARARLMHHAGLANIATALEREAAEDGAARFWGFVTELSARGVDLSDPLRPFEEAAGLRRRVG